MKCLLPGLMSVGFVLPTFAADRCDLKTLTRNCQMFRDLNPGDVIEFADGTKVPACALNSASQTTSERQESEMKPHLATLAEVFAQGDTSDFNSRDIQSWMNGNNLDMKVLAPTKTVEVSWPPGSSAAEWQKVTPQQAREFWERKLGVEGYRRVVAARGELEKIGDKYLGIRYPASPPTYDFSKQEERANRLFSEAKSAVEKRILSGRTEENLSATEKEILARVRAVKRRGGGLQQFDCGIPYGAFFDYGTQEVGVPPGLMFQPDESILRVMTHEISHSFDLCRLSGGADGDAMAGKFARGAGSLDQTPFYETYRCLRSGKGGGFRGPRETGDSPSLESACYPNHHNEAFCDWFAAETMSSQINLRNRGVQGPMPEPRGGVPRGKTVKLPSAMKAIFLQLDYACDTSENERYAETGEHPSWANRVDHIMLRQPKLTEGLSCQSESGKNCPYPTTSSPRGETSLPLPAGPRDGVE